MPEGPSGTDFETKDRGIVVAWLAEETVTDTWPAFMFSSHLLLTFRFQSLIAT